MSEIETDKPYPVRTILAIDPGTCESGWVAFDAVGDRVVRILDFGKDENEAVINRVRKAPELVVIEKLVSYGRGVGNEVLETCEWVGRFTQCAYEHCIPVGFVKRVEEKRELCGTPTANDSMIRNALIAEFAEHDKKSGKGTKQNPDFFYGFKADIWQAFAVGVTYLKKWGV